MRIQSPKRLRVCSSCGDGDESALEGLMPLLNGVRTGEMGKILKRDIDWQARKVRIEQGITGKVKL